MWRKLFPEFFEILEHRKNVEKNGYYFCFRYISPHIREWTLRWLVKF